jgi:hypothetical protein
VAHGVVVRRSPLVGALLLTAALVRGRWALEGHAGVGAEWAALNAVYTADTAELPFQKATRFGLVGQTGATLLRGLGDGWQLGLELRLVWHIPPQVVAIGERHFGNSSVPSAGASLTLRWGTHGF